MLAVYNALDLMSVCKTPWSCDISVYNALTLWCQCVHRLGLWQCVYCSGPMMSVCTMPKACDVSAYNGLGPWYQCVKCLGSVMSMYTVPCACDVAVHNALGLWLACIMPWAWVYDVSICNAPPLALRHQPPKNREWMGKGKRLFCKVS